MGQAALVPVLGEPGTPVGTVPVEVLPQETLQVYLQGVSLGERELLLENYCGV